MMLHAGDCQIFRGFMKKATFWQQFTGLRACIAETESVGPEALELMFLNIEKGKVDA